jgi:hypothetical protein
VNAEWLLRRWVEIMNARPIWMVDAVMLEHLRQTEEHLGVRPPVSTWDPLGADQ